jgi:hypothetical protein
MHPYGLGDLPADVEHRGLAAPRTEEGEHVDRPIDCPIDILVDQRFEVFGLAIVDGAMQRA